jgi:transcription antitermination factor NusG
VQWYAVHVRSNFERKVATALGEADEAAFLPSYRARSRRAGEARWIEKPLFPGYVFARFTGDRFEERVRVLRTPGVVQVVSFADRPVPIEEGIIRSLRIITCGPEGARPHPLLREGTRVRVVDGPFAGATGLLSRSRGRRPRLVVTIEILGRSASVPVDLTELVPFAE